MVEFPIFKTKIEDSPRFDLADPKQRGEYFQLKAGLEIEKMKKYLEEGNTFIAYLLGKKNSGKGTYSKMFGEIFGKEKVFHLSIGDMIRNVDKELKTEGQRESLVKFIRENYRGWMSPDEIIETLEGRSTSKLLPTELILAIVKREIAKNKGKVIFIDGFPRGLDQVAFSLFFRDLVDYRQDPDVFVLISVPDMAIEERIKWRLICPKCNTSRNLKLFPTKSIGYDEAKKEFYLACDNPECGGVKMVAKEGDELGLDPIRERIKIDQELLEKAYQLYGVPKVLLRNAVPIDKAEEYVNDYEITPQYEYKWNDKEGRVEVIEKPWTILDDQGTASFSLLAPPVVVSLVKQLITALGL
ncbi:MAG: nucleoside monophosphate kinase [Candidatus Paceibacterota bacterium]|jgi:adenylate kinase family enzyme